MMTDGVATDDLAVDEKTELPECVHCLGIGGAGMSAIARNLLARGIAVSGSDTTVTPALAALRARGATIHTGHAPAHLGDSQALVVPTAVAEDSPELRTARDRALPVMHRAAMLAAVVGRRRATVAGTVGKTSTTAMLVTAARHCGTDPSFAIGGTLRQTGSNAHHGTGTFFSSPKSTKATVPS